MRRHDLTKKIETVFLKMYIADELLLCSPNTVQQSQSWRLQNSCSRPVGCLAAEGGKFGLGEGPQSISLSLSVRQIGICMKRKLGAVALCPAGQFKPMFEHCQKLCVLDFST